MLEVKSFTAIANSTTQNIFLIILIPFLPIKRSILPDVFSTIKITRTFNITAMMMFSILNSALNDNKVVKLPGPAIKGNANGNTDAVIALFSSSL